MGPFGISWIVWDSWRFLWQSRAVQAKSLSGVGGCVAWADYRDAPLRFSGFFTDPKVGGSCEHLDSVRRTQPSIIFTFELVFESLVNHSWTLTGSEFDSLAPNSLCSHINWWRQITCQARDFFISSLRIALQWLKHQSNPSNLISHDWIQFQSSAFFFQ